MLKGVFGRRKKTLPASDLSAPAPLPTEPPSEAPAKSTIWENYVCLNSDVDPAFELLGPAQDYLATETRLGDWDDFDYLPALERDRAPLPVVKDREGYYGPDHFSYWASGLRDMRSLVECAASHGVEIQSYLDIGCASGRVLRHFLFQSPEVWALGCDINRLHVEWCNAHLPGNGVAFHTSSIPSLPLPDSSLDMVSAFSVFTHIEAMETAWLMEIRRILKPGGLAWITVHTEQTLATMEESWPLWKPVMHHPRAPEVITQERTFAGDRLVLRWSGERSYASNAFYKEAYLRKHWGRILSIVELRRSFPVYQDVLVLQKPSAA